ncbi:ankyrin, partial [Aspergillus uvarum CBS 121591]
SLLTPPPYITLHSREDYSYLSPAHQTHDPHHHLLPQPRNHDNTHLSPTHQKTGLLHIAAQKGHERIVRMLLHHHQPRLDANAPDSEGRTPLMHAVVAGHAAVVRALLAAGARCDPVDHRRRSVLHLAALYRRELVLRVLLGEICGIGIGVKPEEEEDYDDDDADNDGGGGEGDVRRVRGPGMESLLGACDAEGNTPLHLAVADGFEAGVIMLLEAQARR